MNEYDFVIAGAGPCGLGAAWTLQSEFSDHRFLLIDPSLQAGGSAASKKTPEGFIFDYGGHVLFPHQEFTEFLHMLDSVNCDWTESCPIRGVYMRGRLIPAPIQRNVHRLPNSELIPILGDLLILRLRNRFKEKKQRVIREGYESLAEYLMGAFGKQLTHRIMEPLNRKMWSFSPAEISSAWVRERSGSSLRNVPQVSLRRLVKQKLSGVDDPGWLPSTRVKYPASGGTGQIWSQAAAALGSGRMRLGTRVCEINTARRVVTLSDGSRLRYSRFVSSMPLDTLLNLIVDQPELRALSAGLRRSSALLFGFGVRGELPSRYVGVHTFQCPEPTLPFWRITIPSNVAAGNVPNSRQHYSLLCEVSQPSTDHLAVSNESRKQVLDALIEIGLISARSQIVSIFERALPHGYPLPFLGRDELLSVIHRKLLKVGIVSRGRFGGWRYEVSNQDHAFMQGVEAVRLLVSGIPEGIYKQATVVN